MFPLGSVSLLGNEVTLKNDEPLAQTESFYQTHQAVLLEVMKDLSRFGR